MRRLVGAVIALIGMSVTAAFMVATSSAVIQSPTGDTCTASGSGTAYTLDITLPSNAAQEGGFAFGAPGVTVTNIKSSTPGTFSTQNLPPNTTGELLLSNAAVVGATVTIVLTTSGPVTGSFTVVTAQFPPSSTFFDPFLCAVNTGTPAPSNAFTVNQHITYDSAAGAWHLVVTVPGPGTVSGIQLVSAAAGSNSKPRAIKYLIQSWKVVATSAGKFTLTLKLTGDGKKAIKSRGSIKLKLSITFLPKNGKAANRVISLTLKT